MLAPTTPKSRIAAKRTACNAPKMAAVLTGIKGGITMARELLRSVDGRQLPNLGEVAVYWPHQDYTDVFDTTGFEFNDEASYGDRDGDEYPELIEHDAEATAFNLLAALQRLSAAALSRDATMGDPIRLIEVRAELSAANDVACIAIAKALGSAA
jgi:hypothetical protein